MKKLKTAALIFLTLILTSCIQVEDLGSYTNKLFYDYAAAGTWKLTSEIHAGKLRDISKENRIDKIELVDGKLFYNKDLIKSVKINQHNYFVTREPYNKNRAKQFYILTRYTLVDDKLTIYELTFNNGLKYWTEKENAYLLKWTREQNKSIHKKTKKKYISTLDRRFAYELSNIPTDPSYWMIREYIRVK